MSGNAATLQHPSTAEAWAWLDRHRDEFEQSEVERIEAGLRQISTVFWEWDREAGRCV